MVFKGGTYLWFFHGLNRFSEDLDFTTTGKVKSELPEFVSRSLKLIGVENQLRIYKDDGNGLSFRILANGPLTNSEKDRCSVYVEISKREKLQLSPVPLSLNVPGYLIPVSPISGMDLEEVASEKVRAILTRKKARDIFDLYYLISIKGVKFNRDHINLKLKFYGKEFQPEEFLLEIESRVSGMKKELGSMVFNGVPEKEEVTGTIKNWVQLM